MKKKTILPALLALACVASPFHVGADHVIPQEIPAPTKLELEHATYTAKISALNHKFLQIAREIDSHMLYHEQQLLEIEKAYAEIEESSLRIEKAIRHARELFRLPVVLSQSIYINNFLERFLSFTDEDSELLKGHFNEEFRSVICLSEAVLHLLAEDEDVRDEVADRSAIQHEGLEVLRKELDALRKSARDVLSSRIVELFSVERHLESIAESFPVHHKAACPSKNLLIAIRTNVHMYNKVISILGTSSDLVGPSWRVLLDDALFDTVFTNLLFEEDVSKEVISLSKTPAKVKKGKLRRFVEKLIK